jgi:hypothetical protein
MLLPFAVLAKSLKNETVQVLPAYPYCAAKLHMAQSAITEPVIDGGGRQLKVLGYLLNGHQLGTRVYRDRGGGLVAHDVFSLDRALGACTTLHRFVYGRLKILSNKPGKTLVRRAGRLF